MSTVLEVPILQEVKMDISIETTERSERENLVLYVDLQFPSIFPDQKYRRLGTHMAALLKGDTKTPFASENIIFHSYGEGIKEWSITSALTDILFKQLGLATKTGTKMDRWLLQTQAMQAYAHTVCIQVCNEGRSSDFSFPEPWVFRRHHITTASYPSEMVYKTIDKKTE